MFSFEDDKFTEDFIKQLLLEESSPEEDEDLLVDEKAETRGPIDIIFFPKERLSMAKRILSYAVILSKRGQPWSSNPVVAKKVSTFMNESVAFIRIPEKYRATFDKLMIVGNRTRYIFIPSKAMMLATRIPTDDILGRILRIYLRLYGRSGNMFMVLPS